MLAGCALVPDRPPDLVSEREEHERLTKLKALAVFSSDNISSSAYATEEMMRVLVVAGVGAFSLVMPLTLVIVVVLAIVATSYRQTIKAYPNGASSYIVASDNLGAPAGLVAAGALLIDYTLTVAVSVSAGVAAITSIVPALYAEKVLICRRDRGCPDARQPARRPRVRHDLHGADLPVHRGGAGR